MRKYCHFWKSECPLFLSAYCAQLEKVWTVEWLPLLLVTPPTNFIRSAVATPNANFRGLIPIMIQSFRPLPEAVRQAHHCGFDFCSRPTGLSSVRLWADHSRFSHIFHPGFSCRFRTLYFPALLFDSSAFFTLAFSVAPPPLYSYFDTPTDGLWRMRYRPMSWPCVHTVMT